MRGRPARQPSVMFKWVAASRSRSCLRQRFRALDIAPPLDKRAGHKYILVYMEPVYVSPQRFSTQTTRVFRNANPLAAFGAIMKTK